jgi:hypothetical protein
MVERVTQIIVEALYEPTPSERITQVTVETLYQPMPSNRVTQVVVEALMETIMIKPHGPPIQFIG